MDTKDTNTDLNSPGAVVPDAAPSPMQTELAIEGGEEVPILGGRRKEKKKSHTPFHVELDSQDQGPSAQYWLGTDAVGRDLFARLMQGLLISISVALAVEVVDVLLGITIGVLAGFYGS